MNVIVAFHLLIDIELILNTASNKNNLDFLWLDIIQTGYVMTESLPNILVVVARGKYFTNRPTAVFPIENHV